MRRLEEERTEKQADRRKSFSFSVGVRGPILRPITALHGERLPALCLSFVGKISYHPYHTGQAQLLQKTTYLSPTSYAWQPWELEGILLDALLHEARAVPEEAMNMDDVAARGNFVNRLLLRIALTISGKMLTS